MTYSNKIYKYKHGVVALKINITVYCVNFKFEKQYIVSKSLNAITSYFLIKHINNQSYYKYFYCSKLFEQQIKEVIIFQVKIRLNLCIII